MIRVERPAMPPAILLVEGTAMTQADCAAYDGGTRSLTFESSVYGHKDVKEALVEMSHGKCCYCESAVQHISPGTIDHYRPKGAVQQSPHDPLLRPGYYWLAYTWSNLLFLCPECNQYCKRNLFPLAVAQSRARSHHDDLTKEEPLLIDPTSEDPAKLVGYREEYLFPIAGDARGQTTIDVLQLNIRKSLVERRRERLNLLRTLRKVADLQKGTQEAADAEALLSNAKLDSAEYAAMVRSALTPSS